MKKGSQQMDKRCSLLWTVVSLIALTACAATPTATTEEVILPTDTPPPTEAPAEPKPAPTQAPTATLTSPPPPVNEVTPTVKPKKAYQDLVVGFAQISAESEWRTANTASIRETAEQLGVTLKFADGGMRPEIDQIEAMRSFITEGVDVIGISPNFDRPAGRQPGAALYRHRKSGWAWEWGSE
jgi:ABC-type sugar transport system substrate-binding protein